MIDYSEGKIYLIDNDMNDMKYIGSTTTTLKKRFSKHCTGKAKGDLQRAIIAHGREHFTISLIENYPCESKKQLVKREQYYIDTLDTISNGYNKNKAATTKEEYYKDNREHIQEKSAQWRVENRDRYKQQMKEHYEKNRNKRVNATAVWRNNNPEKYTAYRKKKVECDICGSIVLRNGLSTHKKTDKCFHRGCFMQLPFMN